MEDWAYDAGPGCMVNEDQQAANAYFFTYFLDSQKLLPYRCIVTTQRIEHNDEIRFRYGSDTPRGTPRSDLPSGAQALTGHPRRKMHAVARSRSGLVPARAASPATHTALI